MRSRHARGLGLPSQEEVQATMMGARHPSSGTIADPQYSDTIPRLATGNIHLQLQTQRDSERITLQRVKQTQYNEAGAQSTHLRGMLGAFSIAIIAFVLHGLPTTTTLQLRSAASFRAWPWICSTQHTRAMQLCQVMHGLCAPLVT